VANGASIDYARPPPPLPYRRAGPERRAVLLPLRNRLFDSGFLQRRVSGELRSEM
jgi:hypothetical protein